MCCHLTLNRLLGAPLDIPGLDLEKDRGRASVAEALFTDIIGDCVMTAVLILIDTIVVSDIFTLLAYVIASWLVAFRIINPWQPFVRWLLQALGRLHEPLLGRIRAVLPDLGGIDISPIIVLLAVQFARNLLFEYVA